MKEGLCLRSSAYPWDFQGSQNSTLACHCLSMIWSRRGDKKYAHAHVGPCVYVYTWLNLPVYIESEDLLWDLGLITLTLHCLTLWAVTVWGCLVTREWVLLMSGELYNVLIVLSAERPGKKGLEHNLLCSVSGKTWAGSICWRTRCGELWGLHWGMLCHYRQQFNGEFRTGVEVILPYSYF